MRIGGVAQLVDCSPSVHKTLVVSSPAGHILWWWPTSVIPELGRQENQKFKVILGSVRAYLLNRYTILVIIENLVLI